MANKEQLSELGELDPEYWQDVQEAQELQDTMNKMPLYNADPNCTHNVITLWSGVKCSKCAGWFCL